MDDTKKDHDNDETLPQAKRRGRQGVEPGEQPSEYVDEMRTNRFTPPPEPESDDEK